MKAQFNEKMTVKMAEINAEIQNLTSQIATFS